MDMSAAINIAIGCVMASTMDNETKKDIIHELRKCEREVDTLRDIADSCVCGDYESN